MLVLGVPIGLQYALEWGVFGTVLLLMGRIGTVAVAAHQIAINVASLTFMVPLGISAAATVLVGHAVGRGDADGARRSAGAALRHRRHVHGPDGAAVSAAARRRSPGCTRRTPRSSRSPRPSCRSPGAFQIFDGTQVVSIGILRGLADTRAPFVIAVLGFWLLGFPVSLWLGFRTPLGPAGLWWGLVVGLAAVAVLLLAPDPRALPPGDQAGGDRSHRGDGGSVTDGEK